MPQYYRLSERHERQVEECEEEEEKEPWPLQEIREGPPQIEFRPELVETGRNTKLELCEDPKGTSEKDTQPVEQGAVLFRPLLLPVWLAVAPVFTATAP